MHILRGFSILPSKVEVKGWKEKSYIYKAPLKVKSQEKTNNTKQVGSLIAPNPPAWDTLPEKQLSEIAK